MTKYKIGSIEEYAEIEHLRAINAEMLEALKAVRKVLASTQVNWYVDELWEADDILKAAIAKAEGGSDE